jgi:pseudaminic acid synthase
MLRQRSINCKTTNIQPPAPLCWRWCLAAWASFYIFATTYYPTMNTACIEINGRKIGPGHPTYIIAELSANHEQNLDLALASIHAMKEAGADAVKVQTYTADSLTLDSDKPWFMARPDSLWAGSRLYDLYKKAATPWEWHPIMQKAAQEAGLDFFSSPFDAWAVQQLESIDVPAYKIASFEIVDLPLIERCARTGKPLIISTGIATEQDIQAALETCYAVGNRSIALLKCASVYPTPPADANLRASATLAARFGHVSGYSDHTLGTLAAPLAVACGASIIEKHFILDKENSDSVDKVFSLDKEEFALMVSQIRFADTVLGSASLALTEKQLKAKKGARSLFVTEDVKQGELLGPHNVRSLRQSLGLPPAAISRASGRPAACDIERGTPLADEHIG